MSTTHRDNSFIRNIYNVDVSLSIVTPSPVTMAAACMVSGYSNSRFQLGRPNEDSIPSSRIVILSDSQIIIGSDTVLTYGCLLPTLPICVYYDDGYGIPDVGDSVGTIADSYLVGCDRTGFRVCAIDDDLNRIWVISE